MTLAQEAFGRLGLREPGDADFHTIAGFALSRPEAGERFDYDGWLFEIIDMDGRRIDKVLAQRIAPPAGAGKWCQRLIDP
jgi:putative hemolysin